MELLQHLSPSRSKSPRLGAMAYAAGEEGDDCVDETEEGIDASTTSFHLLGTQGVGRGPRMAEERRGLLHPTVPAVRYAPLGQDVPRSNYNRGNARMGAWAGLTLAGWGWTRFLCATASLPSDCVRHKPGGSGVLETLSDVQVMLTFCFVQGWFAEITQPRRYKWVFTRWYFYVLYFLSGTAFSIISSVPALESSLSGGSHYTPLQLCVYIALGVIVLSVICFHFYHAWQVYPFRNFLTYLGARLSVLLFYLIYALIGMNEGGDSLHLHHYFLAWSISLLAQFQHPLSVGLLAVTAGIFVQGIGAYHAASLFDIPRPPCWFPFPDMNDLIMPPDQLTPNDIVL